MPLQLKPGSLYHIDRKPGVFRFVAMDESYAKMSEGGKEFLIWPEHVKLAKKETVEAYVQGVRHGRKNPTKS